MKENWVKSLELLLKHEGGFVDDPHDRGSQTNMGISKKSYPNEDIKNLTVERAGEFYKRDYWNPMKCDNLPSGIDFLIFDFGVNSGSITAIKTLQRALNRFGCNLVCDGFIGKRTLAKAEELGRSIITDLLNERRIFYDKIIQNDPSQERFRRGWMNRVDNLAVEVKEFIKEG